MNLVIVVDDNMVIVNGKPQTVDCSSLTGMHAITWNGTSGTIEYSLINGVKKPPTTFADVSPFQPEIDSWNDANNAPPPPPPTPISQYAQFKQSKIAQGGFTVNANATGAPLNISVATDVRSVNYLASAVQLATLMAAGTIPTTNINWVQNSGTVALTPTQVVTVGVAVAALVQQTFTVLGLVLAAIAAGTITTTSQIDSPPSPIPAWPVNS